MHYRITWSCDVSCVVKDDQTSRRLFHIIGIGMVCLPCVCVYVALIHQNEQISIHSLSMCRHKAFHPCASFDGLLNDLIWCRSLYNLLEDNGGWFVYVWTTFVFFGVWQFCLIYWSLTVRLRLFCSNWLKLVGWASGQPRQMTFGDTEDDGQYEDTFQQVVKKEV